MANQNNEWLEDQKYLEKWRKAMRGSAVNLSAKAVGDNYADYYHRDRSNKLYGTAWAAYETLAEDLNTSVDSIGRGIRDLRKAGLLEEVKRLHFNGPKVNRLVIPGEVDLADMQDTGNAKSASGSAPETDVGVDLADMQDTDMADMQDPYLADMPSYPKRDSFEHDPLNPPTGAHSQVHEPHGVSRFIKEDEPRQRDEFINYLIKIDVPQSYLHVLAIFEAEMQGQNRSDWTGTFKSFMAGIVDNYGLAGNGDPLSDAARQVEETEVPRLDKFDHLDFAREWKGHREGVSEDEFRRAWEHAVMHPDSTGTRVVAVAASAHVAGKYPREFGDVIGGLRKFQLAQAVSKIIHLKKEN